MVNTALTVVVDAGNRLYWKKVECLWQGGVGNYDKGARRFVRVTCATQYGLYFIG